MELKAFQKRVLTDLDQFMDQIDLTADYPRAYEQYWNEKWFKIDPLNPRWIQPYKDNIPQCPHVCVKVPTAWWKTYIACNALSFIFSHFPGITEKVVVWLVPSRTILTQTIKNLSNPEHPYRQRISSHFEGRVEVFTKEMLLQWAWFNQTSIKEQLTICVLSFDTFRSRSKEDRKIYQENSNLANFAELVQKDAVVENADTTSLIHILHHLNPVVIVDESHNAESDLSVEMLKNLNPSFILDLTATPRKNSNIISHISALELKKENMVKLPVLVYNQSDKKEVINNALALQRNLEDEAKLLEQQWWKYIRPIVLFQAEPKSGADTETFSKLKETLIKAWIPADHIAIKTATIDDLKDVDLLSRDCPIRYIITINALKEWWDCPFAYILASLANKSSEIDVTQLIWRILRLPYVQQHNNPFLNVCYVFCSSSKFLSTLDNIVAGLNQAWFNSSATKLDEQELVKWFDASQTTTHSLLWDTLGWEIQRIDWDDDVLLPEDITFERDTTYRTNLQTIKEEAQKSIEAFDTQLAEVSADDAFFAAVSGSWGPSTNGYPMRDLYVRDCDELRLPQFYLEVPVNNLFTWGNNLTLLSREYLNEWFNLNEQDTKINFSEIDSQIYKIDIEQTSAKEYRPTYMKSEKSIQKKFISYLSNVPEETHKSVLTGFVIKEMKYMNFIDTRSVRVYVERVMDGLTTDILQDMKENVYMYAKKIKDHVENLLEKHRFERFSLLLNTNKIMVQSDYRLPSYISPWVTESSITKMLYTEEYELNGLEKEVINEVANLENIVWRHKIIEKNPREFYLNGPINHYPDFVVKTTKGNILLLESKWGQFDGSTDTERKLKLWTIRQSQAWNQFKYFMIFQNESALPGALSFSQIKRVIGEL